MANAAVTSPDTAAASSAGAAFSAAASAVPRAVSRRLQSIDALRGFILVVMLLDHVRETWFLYMPTPDPMDPTAIAPSLFFTRFASNICAPNFVFLTGLGAWLFCQNHGKAETSKFLLKRGLFLLAVEILYMSPVWTQKLPMTFWLQVIWAIGLSMIVLAGLIHLPRKALAVIGLVIVCGHNLLDPIRLAPGDAFYVPWAMLHQRDVIALPFGMAAKTSYPVLAWIGVIALGFVVGPWFGKMADAKARPRKLILTGAALIAAFVALRLLNVYGDKPWTPGVDGIHTVMAFLALTKYPPSLLFLLSTIGAGFVLLGLFEKAGSARWIGLLSVFGAAPMFFYLMHITSLQVLYHTAYAIYGPNHGSVFGVDRIEWVWAWYLFLIPVFYVPTVWFSKFKQRNRQIAILKYL